MYALCFVPGDVDKSDGAGKENGADGAEGGDGEETEEQAAEPEQEEDEDGIHPGDILITGSADGTARSWALATGKQLKVGPVTHRNPCLLTGIGGASTTSAILQSRAPVWPTAFTKKLQNLGTLKDCHT